MQRSHLDPRGKLVYIMTATLLGFGILAGLAYFLSHAQPVEANSNFFALTTGQYPSISGTRIGTCGLCHTSSIPNLNSYGQDFLNYGANGMAFVAIEGLDSDGDGFTNIQEINALTFPGDPNDKPVAAPATNTPFQPATPTNTAGPPTATPTNTDVPPSATPTDTSVAPTDVPPTEVSPTEVPPTDAPPTDVPPTPVPPMGGVDLDIKNFKVSNGYKFDEPSPIQIWVEIRNRSNVDGQGTLVVSGMQNGVQVYSQTITVSDPPGDGGMRYTLPEFTPTIAGVIYWTATLTDGDPDSDVEMTTTKVSSAKMDDDEDDDEVEDDDRDHDDDDEDNDSDHDDDDDDDDDNDSDHDDDDDSSKDSESGRNGSHRKGDD